MYVEKCLLILLLVVVGSIPSLQLLLDIAPVGEVVSASAFDETTLKLVTGRNCYCGNDRVWDNENCVKNETWINVIQVDPWSFGSIETRKLSAPIVEDLTCHGTKTYVVLTRNLALTTDGSLFDFDSGDLFDQYCLRYVYDDDRTILTEAAVCLELPKLSSCCSTDQVFNITDFSCTQSSRNTFNPPISVGAEIMRNVDLTPVINLIPDRCERKYFTTWILDEVDKITLEYQQGKFVLFNRKFVNDDGFSEFRVPSDYCITQDDTSATEMKYLAVVWPTEDLDCFYKSDFWDLNDVDSSSRECDNIMYWLLLPLLIISTTFLFIILILHILLPELRKSIGGKITLCHVISLFVAFCVLLALHVPQHFTCKIYGPLVQVTFLAAFFWLNVMCFDLWWKLRCQNPATVSKQRTERKFVNYSLYAWGSPLVIGMVTVIMDNVDFPPSYATWIVKPGFGDKYCWFVDRKAAFVYYFGIIGVLMAANLIFFIWVCGILLKANCTYRAVLKNNPKSNGRSWIYLRVFSVMGITWICEFISWTEGTCKYWAITDIINSLRGFFLFAIFFGNRKSLNKIQERFSELNLVVHTRVSNSVNSLRKISLKSTLTSTDGGTDSRRTSSTTADLTPTTPTKPQTMDSVEKG